jgi:hypothetical protein
MTAGPGRRLLAHEVRLLVSIVRWVARRPHDAGPRPERGQEWGQERERERERERAFGYARGQGAMMFGLGFVCVLETACMAVLLRDHPDVHRVVLALDLYTLLFVVGTHAASVTRPHILGDTVLRVRRAAHVDLRVPLAAIVSVRRELVTTHERTEGRLDLAVAAQTTVTLELDAPVRHFGLLGRPQDVRVIRFHADESDVLVRAVRDRTLTRERTAPSPTPGRPG